MTTFNELGASPPADATVNLKDEHDTAMWALVMQIDVPSLRRAAERVGPNVWRLWDEVSAHPERYRHS
ncbi:MAG TPA: hypothetical protein VGN46_08960 [Luteibacter sp.]|jgi:hypothetical protein